MKVLSSDPPTGLAEVEAEAVVKAVSVPGLREANADGIIIRGVYDNHMTSYASDVAGSVRPGREFYQVSDLHISCTVIEQSQAIERNEVSVVGGAQYLVVTGVHATVSASECAF